MLSMSVVVEMFSVGVPVVDGWSLHSPDQSQDGDSEGTNDLG